MALLELSSDLSRYRSEVSKQPKNTPEASKATSDKNFATLQPITEKLSNYSSPIKKNTPTRVETRLDSTRLDDIRKVVQEDLTINSVSRYSAINRTYDTRNINGVGIEEIVSKFNAIQKFENVSRLDKSDIVVLRTNPGSNNLLSTTEVSGRQLTFDRTSTSPNISKNPNDATDNIENPDTEVTSFQQTVDRSKTSPDVFNSVPLSFDRTNQSLIINKDVNSPINNIVNPKTLLEKSVLVYDRESQSPNIITNTIKQGLVVDPNTKVIRVENGTFNLEDNSNLNIDSPPIRFITESRLVELEPSQEVLSDRYNQVSVLTDDISNLNVDTVVKTIPFGRNEDPNKSKFSIVGTQQVNFFTDVNASGFIVKAQKGETSYKDSSVFTWSGGSKSAPSTNFITDVNGDGFRTFTPLLETSYKNETSKLGFSVIPQTDFFDVTKKYTSQGFKTFVTLLQSAYQQDASQFVWSGNSGQAPETNYFDAKSTNTKRGFHKFARLYDTKYVPESSVFDWDGGRENSPETNFFDLTEKHTTAGFHRFAQLYDTKYIAESSQFDWDGKREQAPEINYFDLTATHTTTGFHKFAQIYDTKYIPESSIYDWDGGREQSPETNYFDITGKNTISGFHRLAQLYDTKYVMESSIYDWDGGREQAPEVNYFDLTGAHTTTGFHKFAQIYDTKYIAESSIYDWDGGREQSPEVNYFDLTGAHTTTGFHRFAQLYDTKYIAESSIYDWDGGREQAPEVNYFDLTVRNTTAGFHKFAQIYDTKYIPESSIYDWDGTRQQAPSVNYFDLTSANTNAGFHTFAQLYDTKYIHESSIYDWDGGREQSPEVNYFDLTSRNTTSGFHRLAQLYDTKYVHESSIYDWDGTKQSAPEVNYFDLTGKNTTAGFHRNAELYDTKYVKDSSIYDWDGGKQSAPTTNFFVDDKSTGFTKFAPKLQTEYKKDISEFTFKGSLPTPIDFFGNTQASGFVNKTALLDSKYKKDISSFTFKGGSKSAPSVNYFTDTVNKGFTTFVPSLETQYENENSRFVFKGSRSTAPAVDYLTNVSATGFNTLSQLLETKYTKDISTYGWAGGRQDAPSVDFFGIQGDNPKAISGFTNFFINPAETKLSYEHSRFSFAGTQKLSEVKNAPYTTFFGFTPTERSGFMVGMTSSEFSLYPIISPTLSATSNPNTRYQIEANRAQQRRLKTSDLEKYAPLSLGKRPWVDGTLFSTLDSQVPELKTKASPGSFTNKYERSLKDATEKLGYLTKWATTRRSPSPLDDQYNKYKLQRESTNSEPAFFHQPYVVRGIQRDGEVENQRWGFGVTFDDGIIRGGAVTQAERILQDVVRLGKWTASVKGLMFNIKQLGLQAMNPVVDVDPDTPTSGVFGVSSTLAFNPLSILANTATARAGIHYARHGLLPFDSAYLNKYETATKNRELRLRFTSSEQKKFENLEGALVPGDQTNYNRLIGLMKELLPGSFKPTVDENNNPGVGGAIDAAKRILGRREIVRLTSFFGGAQSFFGIGGTPIRRASHPYLVNYTTSPALQKSAQQGGAALAGAAAGGGGLIGIGLNIAGAAKIAQQQPQYEDSAKRDIFFAYNYKYSEYYKTSENYTGFLYALDKALKDGATGTMPKGVSLDTLDKIKKLNPYDAVDRSFTSRVDVTTALNADSHRNDANSLGENTFFSGSSQTYGEAYKSSNGFLALQNLSYQLGGAKLQNSNESGSAPIGTQKNVVDTITAKEPFNPQYRLPNERVTRIISTNAASSIDIGKGLHAGPQLTAGQDTSSVAPIKKYRTLAYNKMEKVKKGQEPNRTDRFNDFRHDLELSGSETFITNPKLARYGSRNVEDYLGMGNHGKVGAQRNVPFKTNIQYVAKRAENATDTYPQFSNFSVPKLKDNDRFEFRGDRINIIDYKRANFNITKNLVYEKGDFGDPSLPGKDDLVEFYFSSIVLTGHNLCPAEVIVFRATFDSISDNHKPSWNSVKYMGRADPLYVYQGYERSISFGFTVHIGSRDEMKATWRKLNYLASWTAPEYTTAGWIRGPLIRLNIGHLYRKMPGYLANLTYTFDNTQGTWETAKLFEDMAIAGKNKDLTGPGVLELPKTIQVSCEFVPIGVYRPEFRGVMYSLYDDTGGSPENGLIPTHDTKVNYFKTYEDIDMSESGLNSIVLPVPPGSEARIDTGTEPPERLFISGSAQ